MLVRRGQGTLERTLKELIFTSVYPVICVVIRRECSRTLRKFDMHPYRV